MYVCMYVWYDMVWHGVVWLTDLVNATACVLLSVYLRVCACYIVCVCVNGSGSPGRAPPPHQCPGGLWVVGREFGFWLCLSLCADITVLMAPNPPFYCTQHFLYKTPTHTNTHTHTHTHTHRASNANLAKKIACSLFSSHADIHVCIYGCTTHT